MCPRTIARPIEPPAVARTPISVADPHEVRPAVHAEVAVEVRSRHVNVGAVRARRPVDPASDRVIREDLDVGAEPLWADEPFGEPARREIVVVQRSNPLGEVEAFELLQPDLTISG